MTKLPMCTSVLKNILLITILITLYDFLFSYLWSNLFVIEMPESYITLIEDKALRNIIWLQFWHTLSVFISSVFISSFLIMFKYSTIKAILISSLTVLLYLYIVGVTDYFSTELNYTKLMRAIDIFKLLCILPVTTFLLSKLKHNKKFLFNF